MGLLDSFRIGESALKAHGTRLEIHAENIANVNTPNYARKIPMLMAKEDISFNGLLNRIKENVFNVGTLNHISGGVDIVGVTEDPTLGDLVHLPGHPDADENGYIRRSNVEPMIDMADAILSSRAYEANLAVITITKSMAQKATEIGR